MRFGLIGLGAAGQLRRAALARAPDCVLTAVFDVDRARTEDISPNVVIFPSAEALLKSDSCEAIIISTPPNSHEHLAVAALENGKHVLVEKPMAHSVEACGRMLESSRRADRVLAVGFNHRYFAAVKVVRDAISSGMIGKLSYIRAYAGHTGLSEFSAPWMYARDVVGGGTLMDNGIHVLDLVCHLMGGVDYIRGTTSSRIWHLDVEDNAFLLLSNKAGVVAHLHTSWSEWKGYRFFIEAYGDRGMARGYYAPMSAMLISTDRPGGRRRVKRELYPFVAVREKLFGWQSTAVRAFVEELQDFVALAQGRRERVLIASSEDGLRVLQIANAVYQSTVSADFIALPAIAHGVGETQILT
jgi:predicted dehydrogenase